MTDDILSRPHESFLVYSLGQMLKVELGRRVGKEEPPNVYVWTEQKLRIVLEVQFMCLKLRRSPVPFRRELFFPHLNVSLCVAWSSFNSGGHTGPCQGSVVAGSNPLPSETGGETILQARAWSSPNCSEG